MCILWLSAVVATAAVAWVGCDAESSCDPSSNCVPEVPIAADAGGDTTAADATGG
jgi:hypothetical protein